MKPKFRSLAAAFAPHSRSSLIICASLCAATSARAASQTWDGETDATWATVTNWVSNTGSPGSVTTTTNDVATFNSALFGGTVGGAANPVVIDLNRRIGSILFDTASVGPYVIGATGANTLLLSAQAGGPNSVTMSDTVTISQTLAGPMKMVQPSGQSNNYGFTNNSTTPGANLIISGNIDATNTTRTWQFILGGTNTGNNIISGNINNTTTTGNGGAGPIQKNGEGTWILSGTNIFIGNTSGGNNVHPIVTAGAQVNAGTLVLQNNLALGNTGGAKVFVNGGVLELNSSSANGSITLDNALTVTVANGATFRSAGSNATNGRISIPTGAGVNATLSTVGAADVFTIGNAANDLFGGAADSVITVGGPGTVFNTQTSTGYLGKWSIGNGTLKSGSATDGLGVNGSVEFASGSTGRLQLGNSLGLVSLTTNGGTPTAGIVEADAVGTQTLTLTTASANAFGGTLRDGGGTLAITKAGAGTLTLSGNSNTYSGGTIVSGGVLNVTNTSGSATGTGAVTVGGLTTLGGAGIVSGAVTVNSGGTLSPGNSVGTLTVGSLTLDAGSKLNYEFGTFPANDLVNVTSPSGLTINGGGFTLTDAVSLGNFSTINTYNVIGYSGTISGAGVNSLSVLNPQVGRNYIFAATGSFVTLKIESSGVISDWNIDANGSWNGGNWTGVAPNGVGQTGNFSKALTAPRTVTLDGNKTLGGISFNGGASPLGYTIAPGSGGTLSLNNGINQANVIVTTGTNTISSDVSLDSTNTVAAVAAGSSLTISGSLGGSGSLVKSGPGLLSLTSAGNGYAGNTSVIGGSLGFSALGSLGGGNLTLDGGALLYNTGNTSDVSGKVITLGIAGGTIDTNGNDVVFANPIGNGGVGGLTKAGNGKLSLAAGNNYSGPNSITGGTLAIAADTSLGVVPGAAAANLTISAGSTLQASATSTLVANRNVVLSGGTASVDTNGFNLSIAGNISGGGLLRKTGAGNLTLTGTNNVTATGGITIDEGIVFTNSRANLPGGTITLNGSGGISNGNAASNYSDVVVNGTNSIVKTGTGAILGLGILSGNGTLTFGGTFVNDFQDDMSAFTGTIIANAGGFRWNGSTGGTNVTLDLVNHGISVRNGATAITIGALSGIAGSSLNGSGGGSTQAVTFTLGGKTVDGQGVTAVDSVFNGSINNGVGAVTIIKEGASSLTLGGLNTYTGNTTVGDGKLFLSDNARLTFRLVSPGVSNFINGNGQVKLDGDFSLDLSNPAAAVDGSTWTLVDLNTLSSTDANPIFGTTFSVLGFNEVSPGVWTQVSANNNWTFTEATGELTLAVISTPYGDWIGSFTFAVGADLSPEGDPDGDGMTNQQEYAFGLIPNDGASLNPIISTLNKTTGQFTYTRRDPSLTNLTSYKILTSTTLDAGSWTVDATATANQVPGPVDGNGNQSVVVTLTGVKPLTATKLFVRVSAE